MSTFLRKIFLFVGPLVIISILIEIKLRSIPNDYSFKYDYLRNHSQQVEVLVLGSSHSYRGIDPSQMSFTAFNASHIGQSIDLDYRILKEFIPNMSELKYIILPIDYFTLFARTSTGVEPWRIKNYNIYYKFGSRYDLFGNSELLTFGLRTSVMRLKDLLLYNKSELFCTKTGFGIDNLEKGNLTLTGKSAAERHTLMEKGFLEESMNILEKIHKLSEQYQIEVVLITFPVYQTYLDNINKPQLDVTLKCAEELAKKYSNFEYYNFLFDHSFSVANFRDADHLNHSGAKILTEKIDSILTEFDKPFVKK